MAGFAIHLCQFFKHPEVRVGVNVHGSLSKTGHLETDLLEHFTNESEVECRGSEAEVNNMRVSESRVSAHYMLRYLAATKPQSILDER